MPHPWYLNWQYTHIQKKMDFIAAIYFFQMRRNYVPFTRDVAILPKY